MYSVVPRLGLGPGVPVPHLGAVQRHVFPGLQQPDTDVFPQFAEQRYFEMPGGPGDHRYRNRHHPHLPLHRYHRGGNPADQLPGGLRVYLLRVPHEEGAVRPADGQHDAAPGTLHYPAVPHGVQHEVSGYLCRNFHAHDGVGPVRFHHDAVSGRSARLLYRVRAD